MTGAPSEKPAFLAVTLRPEVPHEWIARTTAAVTCIFVALRVPLVGGMTVSLCLAVLLSPAWIRTLLRYRGGATVLLLTTLAVISGSVMSDILSIDHVTNLDMVWHSSLSIIELTSGIGLLVWARTVLGDRATCLWYAIGLMAVIGLRGINADNPWKFTFLVPSAVLVLGVVGYAHHHLVQLLALGALAAVSTANDSRSAASIFLLVVVLIGWQMLQRLLHLQSTTTRTLLLIGAVGVGGYFAMQAFLLEGFLGQESQARSVDQVTRTGSVITGGRPELGATVALLQRSPLGFGSGTVPNGNDLLTAKAGMHALNYDPNNGYVERYMFGQGYEVHSLVGDAWIRYGLFGALLLLALVIIIIVGTARLMSAQRAHALLLFLAVQSAWDAFFSPLFPAGVAVLTLAVAMTLAQRNIRPSAASIPRTGR